MKKANVELNSIFSIWEEMIKDNGEDCFYNDFSGDEFIVAAFDGLGGAGSKKYENYSGKTGAYVASRAVSGGVKAWFNQSRKATELNTYIKDALGVCTHFADKSGRIMGSLGKSFPTTAAIIKGQLFADKISCECYWAGDSRCYMIDFAGLHQLTADDLDGQDAMSNLTDDGVMTNVISASSPFELHGKRVELTRPCILFSATDGCFGYLNSPMEFEQLMIESLLYAENIIKWKENLTQKIKEVAGDDFTLSVAVCGFKDFIDMKKYLAPRYEHLMKNYISSQQDVHSLWEKYKKDYSVYL